MARLSPAFALADRRRHRRLKAVAAGALAVLIGTVSAGAGTATAQASDDAQDEKVLTVAISQEVDSLSPFLAVRVITTMLGRLQYDFLTNYDPKTGESIPALAESWDTSEDGLTWTFKIREEAKWTDGEDITAEDVAWTFNTMMTDEAAATANGNFVENFKTVEATDEDTVEITLEKPQATMLALDVPILPKHIWENVEDFAEFNNDEQFPIVGSGPFILTEYDVNQSITLEPNPDFWNGAPGFDKLVFRYYNDSDAQVEALKKGEVTFVSGLTPAQADSLRNEPNITVNQAKGKRFQGMTLNPGAKTQGGQAFGDGNPALQDPVVRKALVQTIDREAIYDVSYGGYGEANGGYIPSRYSIYHWEPESGDVVPFDIEAANTALDEAGYVLGGDGVRVSPAGQRLSFRFNVHANNPQYVQSAEMMREWAAEAGIELKVEPVEEVGALLDAGTYDILTTGWTVNPDPDYIMSINLCSGLPAEIGGPYLSDAYFCDEEYDSLYQDQVAELDVDARAGIVKDMQKILYDTNVFVVWGYADALEAYRSDVIESIQTQPDPGGNIYGQDGYWSWWSAVPVGAEESAGDSNMGAVVGVAAGAAVVLAGGAFLLMRRRSATADERE